MSYTVRDYRPYEKQGVTTPETALKQCGCIGPQNGEPLCPCQMRDVKIVNGRYVRTQDLGPAGSKAEAFPYPPGAFGCPL